MFESFERENGRVLVFPSSVDGSETRAKLAEIGGTKKSPILGHIKWEQASAGFPDDSDLPETRQFSPEATLEKLELVIVLIDGRAL